MPEPKLYAFSSHIGSACAKQMRTFTDLAEKLKIDVVDLMRQCNAKAPPSKSLVKGLAWELDIAESFLEKPAKEVRNNLGDEMTGKRGTSKLAVTALVFVVAITAVRARAGTWIRHDPNNHGVIVFVHGILGDERTTWTSGNAYWPEMLTHDHTFDGQDIYMYHYPSPHLGQAFTIDEVAENMRSVLTTDGVLEHTEITFVSHSMGGIVTRAFILKYRKELVPKIRFLFFFATPTSN